MDGKFLKAFHVKCTGRFQFRQDNLLFFINIDILCTEVADLIHCKSRLLMALLETPHLNQSAVLKLKTPNLNVAAMAKFSASFNDFSPLFSAKRNKTQR